MAEPQGKGRASKRYSSEPESIFSIACSAAASTGASASEPSAASPVRSTASASTGAASVSIGTGGGGGGDASADSGTPSSACIASAFGGSDTVSYTHLTLPTKA